MKIISLMTLALKPDIQQHLAISSSSTHSIPFISTTAPPIILKWISDIFHSKVPIHLYNIETFLTSSIVKYLFLFYFLFFPVLLSYSQQGTPFNSNHQKFIVNPPASQKVHVPNSTEQSHSYSSNTSVSIFLKKSTCLKDGSSDCCKTLAHEAGCLLSKKRTTGTHIESPIQGLLGWKGEQHQRDSEVHNIGEPETQPRRGSTTDTLLILFRENSILFVKNRLNLIFLLNLHNTFKSRHYLILI